MGLLVPLIFMLIVRKMDSYVFALFYGQKRAFFCKHGAKILVNFINSDIIMSEVIRNEEKIWII